MAGSRKTGAGFFYGDWRSAKSNQTVAQPKSGAEAEHAPGRGGRGKRIALATVNGRGG